MKVSFRLPDPVEIEPFITSEQGLNYTYPAVGSTVDPAVRVPGFDHDVQRVVIGTGPEDFERARAALQRWLHFPAGWTKILPDNTPIRSGATIAMLFRMFGCWWRNSCRIVDVVDEPRRFGFAYGTLPAHMERGEEIFLVDMDEAGTVWYELRAFSNPRALLARLGYPLVRQLQEKFRQDSALAMRRAVRGESLADEPAYTPDGWFLRFGLFAAAAAWLWPGSLMNHDYGRLPLALAFLLIVPATWMLAARHFPALRAPFSRLRPWMLTAGMTAIASLALPSGLAAGALAVPWALVCGWTALNGLRIWSTPVLFVHSRRVAAATISAGMVYLSVAGFALFSERIAYHPFGFGDDVMRLTALHFHYAGFALPVLAGITASLLPGRLSKWSAACVAAGVPLTALGITATQLHAGPFLETFAAAFMAFAGALLALSWLQSRNGWLLAAGLVLGGSMVLALTYALRVVVPDWALSLDWMRALHGTLNGLVAIPLGLFGLWRLGWPDD